MSIGGWGNDWPEQPTPKTYEQGIAEGERRATAAVVAWLRALGTSCDINVMADAIDVLADGIENGEHHKEER